MKDPSALVHVAMLAGIGAFIYAITRPDGSQAGGQAGGGTRVQGGKMDPLTSWFDYVKAPAGSWEAREQASEWMIRHMDDRQMLAFGLNMLHGWLDLKVKSGPDVAATRTLIRELAPLFE